jgi:hypothetical protein
MLDLASTGIASVPTLRAWLKSKEDEPWLIKVGSKGDAYEIDIPAAVEAFRAHEEHLAQAARDRAESIRQIALDLGINAPADDVSAALSIAERRQLLEEEVVAMKLARLRGELVSFISVQSALGDVFEKFRQRGVTFGARLAKKIDLSRDQITAIDRLMQSDLADLAASLEKLENDIGDVGAADGDADTAATMENTAA